MATFLFATDFSDAAETSLDSAIAWAARARASVHVVHVVPQPLDAVESLELLGARLAARVGALQAQGHVVQGEVRSGAPVDVILQVARDVRAELIVMGAVGERSPLRLGVGSVVEGVALRSSVPVLALRGGLQPWLGGERPLRVLVGVDLSTSAAAAVRWSMALTQLGLCDFTLVHAYSQRDLAHLEGRLALRGDVPGGAEVLAVLRRDLEARVASGDLPIVLDETSVTPARRLAALADETGADLVVIGAPPRTGLDRVVRGSTVHGLLARASTSLALIPSDVAPTRPGIRRVLVPIDFSSSSQNALPYARGLLDEGGALVLVHVAEIQYDADVQRESRHRQLEQRLIALGPHDAGITVEARVVEEVEAGPAIVTVADREGVDAICMSTRENSLAKAIFGSVARAVTASSHIPVFLIPPDPA